MAPEFLKVHLKDIRLSHEAIKYLYSDLENTLNWVFYINQIHVTAWYSF